MLWGERERQRERKRERERARERERESERERERESRHRLWIFFLVFCCSSIMLVHWFHLSSCASCVKPLFGAHPKMGAVTFDYLHMIRTSVNSRLYFVTSPSQLSFKPESSAYFRLCRREGHIRFPWFFTCTVDLGPLVFSSYFNYQSPSSLTGWPTTSALVKLLSDQLAVPYTLCLLLIIFLLSLLPQ